MLWASTKRQQSWWRGIWESSWQVTAALTMPLKANEEEQPISDGAEAYSDGCQLECWWSPCEFGYR